MARISILWLLGLFIQLTFCVDARWEFLLVFSHVLIPSWIRMNLSLPPITVDFFQSSSSMQFGFAVSSDLASITLLFPVKYSIPRAIARENTAEPVHFLSVSPCWLLLEFWSGTSKIRSCLLSTCLLVSTTSTSFGILNKLSQVSYFKNRWSLVNNGSIYTRPGQSMKIDNQSIIIVS